MRFTVETRDRERIIHQRIGNHLEGQHRQHYAAHLQIGHKGKVTCGVKAHTQRHRHRAETEKEDQCLAKHIVRCCVIGSVGSREQRYGSARQDTGLHHFGQYGTQ